MTKPALDHSTAQKRFRISCLIISLTALFLAILRVPAPWSPLWSIGADYGLGIVVLTGLLLGFHFIATRIIDRRRQGASADPAAWYRRYFKERPYADILCAILAVTVTVSCFTVHKAEVVGAEGYGFDAMFIAWDRAIFAGNDPWRLTHALIPSARLTYVLDFLYHPAFLPMIIGYSFCASTTARTALRYTYMSAFLAGYLIVGMILAAALHSAGPVYDGVLFGDGQTFAPLLAQLEMLQKEAGPYAFFTLQTYLITLHQGGEIGLGAGISAMPSMHIVLAFLWTFAAWHLGRVLGIILTIYGAVIWFTSVHTGWHYFVDGLVGLAVLAMLWAGFGRLYGLYGR